MIDIVDLLGRIGGTVDPVMWRELRSLVRTTPLAISAPRIIGRVHRLTDQFTREFQTTVQPILKSAITDAKLRQELTKSLLSYATVSSFFVSGYTTMAGVPFTADLSILALSFTRLYDDLLDDVGGQNLERRLSQLIEHGRFTPESEVEQLLDRLYREIEGKLSRRRDDPVYAAVQAAHRYQVQSRDQRDPTTPHATLMAITRGKGRYGTLTVFALMRPNLSAQESELIMDVGEALQMLDDYADCESDRRAGIRTLATEGRLDLTDVAEHLRNVRPRLAAYYGRNAAQEFLGICYLAMCVNFLDRRIPRLGAMRPMKASTVHHGAEHAVIARGRPIPVNAHGNDPGTRPSIVETVRPDPVK